MWPWPRALHKALGAMSWLPWEGLEELAAPAPGTATWVPRVLPAPKQPPTLLPVTLNRVLMGPWVCF